MMASSHQSVEALFQEKESFLLCYRYHLPPEVGPTDFFDFPEEEEALLERVQRIRSNEAAQWMEQEQQESPSSRGLAPPAAVFENKTSQHNNVKEHNSPSERQPAIHTAIHTAMNTATSNAFDAPRKPTATVAPKAVRVANNNNKAPASLPYKAPASLPFKATKMMAVKHPHPAPMPLHLFSKRLPRAVITPSPSLNNRTKSDPTLTGVQPITSGLTESTAVAAPASASGVVAAAPATAPEPSKMGLRVKKTESARQRTKRLKQELVAIQQKPPERRTRQEEMILAMHEKQRARKNQLARKRFKERQRKIERISNTPMEERTLEEQDFLDATQRAKRIKNESDKVRRQRLKQLVEGEASDNDSS